MKKIFYLFFIISWFLFGINNTVLSSDLVNTNSQSKNFIPFNCNKLETEFLRVNKRNDCLIVQELSNEYEVKSNEVDPNTWNRSLLLRYIDNSDGEKIIAHTWNNVVKWGESSNKQPFSHLAVIDIPNLDQIQLSDVWQCINVVCQFI